VIFTYNSYTSTVPVKRNNSVIKLYILSWLRISELLSTCPKIRNTSFQLDKFLNVKVYGSCIIFKNEYL